MKKFSIIIIDRKPLCYPSNNLNKNNDCYYSQNYSCFGHCKAIGALGTHSLSFILLAILWIIALIVSMMAHKCCCFFVKLTQSWPWCFIFELIEKVFLFLSFLSTGAQGVMIACNIVPNIWLPLVDCTEINGL